MPSFVLRFWQSFGARFLTIVLVLVLAGALITRAALAFLVPEPPSFSSIDTCYVNDANVSERATCLREAVGNLMKVYSTSDIQGYTVATSSSQRIQDNCHPIAHIIGDMTYQTSPSLEAAMARCSAACRNGCIHGAMAAAVSAQMGKAARTDDLAHQTADMLRVLGVEYCTSSESICHGIGHLFFMQLGDFQKSFEGCDAVATGFAREACYQGVFMEDIGGVDSVTLNPVQAKGQPDDNRYPCSSVAPKYQHACFQFLGKYQLHLLKLKNPSVKYMDKNASVQVCEAFSEKARAYCFEGMGTIHNITYGVGDAGRQAFCDDLPLESDRLSCTTGISATFTYLAWLPDLVRYCDGIQSEERRTLCYNTAFQLLSNTERPDGETRAMCEAQKSEKCVVAFGMYLNTRSELPDYRFGLFGE